MDAIQGVPNSRLKIAREKLGKEVIYKFINLYVKQ